MNEFLLYSIVASVLLTLALNLLPLLFPNATRRTEEKLRDSLNEALEQQRRGESTESRPRVQFFLPWKTMLFASLLLTVLVNLIDWAAA